MTCVEASPLIPLRTSLLLGTVPSSMRLHIPFVRLCLFHHFSLISVLLLWMSRLRNSIVSSFVHFKCIYYSYISLCFEVDPPVFYFINLLDALCLTVWLDLFLADLHQLLSTFVQKKTLHSSLWRAASE